MTTPASDQQTEPRQPPVQATAYTEPNGAENVPLVPPVQDTGANGTSVAENLPEIITHQTPWWKSVLHDGPGWVISMLLHIAFVLLLALWVLPRHEKGAANNLVIAPLRAEEPLVELFETPPLEVEVSPLEATKLPTSTLSEGSPVTLAPSFAQDFNTSSTVAEVPEFVTGLSSSAKLFTKVGTTSGSGLDGRGTADRGSLVREGGGTEASERAVSLALKWLADHQHPDGSWNYDQNRCPTCRGRCKDHSHFSEMTNAATAMALLPFLGAGQTHLTGEYQETVHDGLAYLGRKMKRSRFRHRYYKNVTHGNLTDPGQGMYSHGLAAIALCEAYGMTQDKKLHDAAQFAVNYCITGQDLRTGGWGYLHGTGNDTSVAGWQIMAMKSARMAYLDVPDGAFRRSYLFLDSVQANGGSHYGYRNPGTGAGTTAVGLLCRMYLGWKQDNEALQRGVEAIAEKGPSPNNMYFNYYAMQVMFQYTGGKGPMWENWNTVLRDAIIENQAQSGHEIGSWDSSRLSYPAGRLYATCMATMCLEVYYRHMPIYREQAAGENEFPLE